MNSPVEEQEQKIEETRQRIQNLIVMQLRPNQSAETLQLLSDLERSARAEVKPPSFEADVNAFMAQARANGLTPALLTDYLK